MIYNIILTMFVWYADPKRVLSNSMLDPFFWYKVPCYTVACWHGSSGRKSPVDQGPVLYNSLLARFFLYKVAC